MALLPHRILLSLLGLRVHSLLLRHPTAHHRLRQYSALLLLRGPRMRCLRPTNGHRRLLDRVRFCEEDLRRYQGRLRKSGVLQLFGSFGGLSLMDRTARWAQKWTLYFFTSFF